MSGLIADSRTMVDKARVEAQVNPDFISLSVISHCEPENQTVHRKLIKFRMVFKSRSILKNYMPL